MTDTINNWLDCAWRSSPGVQQSGTTTRTRTSKRLCFIETQSSLNYLLWVPQSSRAPGHSRYAVHLAVPNHTQINVFKQIRANPSNKWMEKPANTKSVGLYMGSRVCFHLQQWGLNVFSIHPALKGPDLKPTEINDFNGLWIRSWKNKQVVSVNLPPLWTQIVQSLSNSHCKVTLLISFSYRVLFISFCHSRIHRLSHGLGVREGKYLLASIHWL